MKQSIFYLLILVLISGCSQPPQDNRLLLTSENGFIPPDSTCILFAGQDMEAIGGIEGYDGYCDYFEMPAGITVYTNFAPGNESFGFIQKGNDGIFSLANWGAGDCFADKQINAEGFENSMLAIGLSLVGGEEIIPTGEYDSLIIQLGEWMQGLNRPVFLRIGYEFDGHDWNHYDRESYLQSWQHIYTIYQDMGIKNITYVWQSKGVGTSAEEMEGWYPGDELVDWVGYSYFGNPDTEMIKFARKHSKPVFIAEATPVMEDSVGNYISADIKDPEVARQMWDNWFVGFIKTVKDNPDVVKAVSYINVNWPSQPMWIDNPTFQQVDSRIQMDSYVKTNWENLLSDENILQAKDLKWKINN